MRSERVSRAVDQFISDSNIRTDSDSLRGRLFVVIEPAAAYYGPPLADLSSLPDLEDWLFRTVGTSQEQLGSIIGESAILTRVGNTTRVEPFPSRVSGVGLRAGGVGVEAHGGNGQYGLLEILESGGLRLGRNSMVTANPSQLIPPTFDQNTAVSITLFILAMQVAAFEKVGTVPSTIDIAVKVDGLKDVRPWTPPGVHPRGVYTDYTYRGATHVQPNEMADLGPAIARLWGPLLRAFGLGRELVG